MQEIKKLLELLTDKFPPFIGRHTFALVKGANDEFEQNVEDHDNVNVMICLSTENGFLPIYFTDDELNSDAEEQFQEIINLLEDQGLIQ